MSGNATDTLFQEDFLTLEKMKILMKEQFEKCSPNPKNTDAERMAREVTNAFANAVIAQQKILENTRQNNNSTVMHNSAAINMTTYALKLHK